MTTTMQFARSVPLWGGLLIGDGQSDTAVQSVHGASAYTQTDTCTVRLEDVPNLMCNEPDLTSPEKWSTVINQLSSFRTLEDDWNGEGTEAPQPDLVHGAVTLAKWFQSLGAVIPDRVHVGVNSTIYLEWYTPVLYQEVEVISPNHAEFRSIDRATGKSEVIEFQRT